VSVSRGQENEAEAQFLVQRTGPVLSDEVPQELHHDGQFYIQLKLAPADFIATARGLASGTQGGQI
jgi:hypothetical protein